MSQREAVPVTKLMLRKTEKLTFFEILHKLILGPIELLFDVVFSFSMQITQNPVLSIVVLSLAINLLVLPL